MKHRQFKLRSRITWAFTIFTALLTLTLSVAVYRELDKLDIEIVHTRLHAKLELVIHQGLLRPDTLHQITPDTFIVYPQQHVELLPKEVKLFKSVGFFQMPENSSYGYVLIEPYQAGWVYVIKGGKEFRFRERNILLFLILSSFLATLFSWVLARALSGSVIQPVTKLANQVTQLSPEKLADIKLADGYPDDEVGALAQTFDLYLARNRQFIQREQAFTSDVSHELRTPLTVIRNNTTLLLESDRLGERENRQLQGIERAVGRIIQITETLLLLAREKTNPSTTVTSLQDVLRDVLEQFQWLIKQKNIEITWGEQLDVQLTAPKAALQIVIGNLLKNAIEHTSQGAIYLQITSDVLLIRDSGSGFNPEVQSHLFDGYQGKSTKSGGTGIGLSLVKRICDTYAWRIEISNLQPQGAEIRIVFSAENFG